MLLLHLQVGRCIQQVLQAREISPSNEVELDALVLRPPRCPVDAASADESAHFCGVWISYASANGLAGPKGLCSATCRPAFGLLSAKEPGV